MNAHRHHCSYNYCLQYIILVLLHYYQHPSYKPDALINPIQPPYSDYTIPYNVILNALGHPTISIILYYPYWQIVNLIGMNIICSIVLVGLCCYCCYCCYQKIGLNIEGLSNCEISYYNGIVAVIVIVYLTSLTHHPMNYSMMN